MERGESVSKRQEEMEANREKLRSYPRHREVKEELDKEEEEEEYTG